MKSFYKDAQYALCQANNVLQQMLMTHFLTPNYQHFICPNLGAIKLTTKLLCISENG